MDDNGKDVLEGQPGEVLVKGPVVTKGYYGNAQATQDSFIDGWFCTGDVAIWKNGLPYIVDRKKVMAPSHTCTRLHTRLLASMLLIKTTGIDQV